MIEQLRRLAFVATGAIAGCALQPSPDGSVAGGCAPGGCPACPVCPAQPAALPRANPLEPVDFSALTGWKDGEQAAACYALAELARGAVPVAGKEILWVEDPIQAFLLRIQGSCRVQVDSRQTLRRGYADQIGHHFQSIGRHLVERGELQLEEASMQSIK